MAHSVLFQKTGSHKDSLKQGVHFINPKTRAENTKEKDGSLLGIKFVPVLNMFKMFGFYFAFCPRYNHHKNKEKESLKWSLKEAKTHCKEIVEDTKSFRTL